MDLSQSFGIFKNIKNNRWQNDFVEQEKVGRGGFASVYKAKNCFDDQTYAVKKIRLRVKDIKKNFEQEIQRILDEAKFLAKVNHPNVLRYYNSWLEATTQANQQKPQTNSKSSLFKNLIVDNKKRSSLSSLNECDSDEEKRIDTDDSPAIIFERSQKAEESSLKSSRTASSGSFSKVLEKRKKSFASVLGERNDNSEKSVEENNLTSKRFKISPEVVTSNFNPLLLNGEKLETVSLYIQTELCSETLEDYLQKRNEKLEQTNRKDPQEYQKTRIEYLKEALLFAKQILEGISHIHSHNIVHRDLKPSNIFITSKMCKIGDFGLIKKLHSISPLEASPVLQQSNKQNLMQDVIKTSNILQECKENYEFELFEEELPEIDLQKTVSVPLWKNQNCESVFNTDDLMTKSVGTKIYASPEQWQADKTNFDQRADIFSLGIILLLLFHPMGTYMEQFRVINDSKDGKVPNEFFKELPDIAVTVKSMLSINPSNRPTLEKIIYNLKLPPEMYIESSGVLQVRKENCGLWKKKYFKLIDTKLYIFNKREERKAEIVYDISDWQVKLKDFMTCFNKNLAERSLSDNINTSDDNKNSFEASKDNVSIKTKCVTFENPFQLGCAFRGENQGDTLRLFQLLSKLT